MQTKWVVTTPNPPIAADFQTTRGLGSPIVIDEADDQAYYFKSGAITPLAGGGGSSLDIDGGDASSSGTPYLELDGGDA